MRQSTRLVAEEVRHAHLEHYCDQCDERIFPGDIYERIVRVTQIGESQHMTTRKHHLNPPCPFPDPQEDEEGLLIVNAFEFSFSLAA